MWTLHFSATYVLIPFFQGKEGASLEQYVHVANDVLSLPEGTIQRVEQPNGQQPETEDGAGAQSSLPDEPALASIEHISLRVTCSHVDSNLTNDAELVTIRPS